MADLTDDQLGALLKSIGTIGATAATASPVGQAAALGLGAASGIYQTISGIVQNRRSKQLQAQLDAQGQPQYQPSQALLQQVALTQNRYQNPNLTGYNRAQDRLALNTAQAAGMVAQGAQTSGDYVNAITNLYGNQVAGLNDLAIAGAQQQNQDFNAYNQALGNLGQAQDTAFQINQLNPYLQKQQAAASQLGASNLNINSGINQIGSVANAFLTARTPRNTTPANQNLFNYTLPLNYSGQA